MKTQMKTTRTTIRMMILITTVTQMKEDRLWMTAFALQVLIYCSLCKSLTHVLDWKVCSVSVYMLRDESVCLRLWARVVQLNTAAARAALGLGGAAVTGEEEPGASEEGAWVPHEEGETAVRVSVISSYLTCLSEHALFITCIVLLLARFFSAGEVCEDQTAGGRKRLGCTQQRETAENEWTSCSCSSQAAPGKQLELSPCL